MNIIGEKIKSPNEVQIGQERFYISQCSFRPNYYFFNNVNDHFRSIPNSADDQAPKDFLPLLGNNFL